MNESTPVIDSIELIPLGPSDLSPLLTNVKVKVFHLGENRNRSSIDKNVAIQMAKTLRGLPIVGKYRQEKGDFTDHGDVMVIDDRGVTYTTETKPYGFIDLNATVWFEDYIDIDENGNQLTHTYVVTQGVVWTGQNPELKEALNDGGRPQSMELDEKTLTGYWSKSVNSGIDFFIINSSILTKLCILGDDTEPCFIGSSVVPEELEVGSTFTKLDGKDDFSATLFTMLKQLRELKNNKGGYSMDGVMETPVLEEEVVVATEFENEEVKTTFEDGGEAGETTGENAPSGEESTDPSANGSETPANEGSDVQTQADKSVEETAEQIEEAVNSIPSKKIEYACGSESDDKKKKFDEEDEEFACGDGDKKKKFADKKDEEEASADEESANSEGKDDESKSEENDNTKEDENKKKYELLEQEYTELQEKFSLLETETAELRKFKVQVENAEKDELIASFYMLSDEDKKEVIENKTNYSLEDIEAKLSVIYVKKKVNFNLEDEAAPVATEEVPTTFDMNAHEVETLPAWLAAVKSNRDK